MSPLFDDHRQYAHYFRYRSVDKLELGDADYRAHGGGPHDTPFSDFELRVPPDRHGVRRVRLRIQPQKMYETYRALLDALNAAMGWGADLVVGDDLSYANMVASRSAKWTTVPAPAGVPSHAGFWARWVPDPGLSAPGSTGSRRVRSR
jgi:hypothetical protein